jgi:hypothetical protein
MSHDIWSIVLLSGISTWIVSSFMLMFSAFPQKGEFNIKYGIRWGIISIVSFSVWVLGLLQA